MKLLKYKLKLYVCVLLLVLISVVQPITLKSQPVNSTQLVQLSAKGPLEIKKISTNSNRIGLYEKFEISFDLSGDWDNPFDLCQIEVNAHFYAPKGDTLIVPGFFYQEYYPKNDGRLKMVGNSEWKVRFAPTQPGEYSWQIVVNNKGREIRTNIEVFESINYNTSHGFLRISKDNPHYFEFIDGTPFFGVGMDREQGNTYPNEKIYHRFANAGGNFNRLFLTNGTLNLGEIVNSPRPDCGIGKINLEAAWHLDQVLETGEKLGIYHMLSLTNQWTFNQKWETHAYNQSNGGVINSPVEYWNNKEALNSFEKYLRYIVARWGFSTSVFSWDLWNEYSAMPGGTDSTLSIPWHQRMSRYLDSIDAFNHVIHTNDAYLNGFDWMHSLPEMEMISTNIYMVRNMADVAYTWSKRFTEQFEKPYVLTEFGTGHGRERAVNGYSGVDPERRMIHNGFWGALMGGSASTALPWEFNWLDHKIFYTYIKAISTFVENIPFSKRKWRPVEADSFRFKKRDDNKSGYSDVIVEGWTGNFNLSKHVPNVFKIDETGHVDHPESLSAVLDDKSNSTVEFQINYPTNGEFMVYVCEVHNSRKTPQLTVVLDEHEVLKEDMLPLNIANYQPFLHNQAYSIPVSKGNHRIRIENSGKGSFVTSFELKNYIPKNNDLEIRGLQTDDYILLWFKNQKFTLLHSLVGIAVQPQAEGVLHLKGVADGYWIAEWLNTVDATKIKKEIIESRNHQIVLETPIIKESVAVRLQKLK
ncbi:MAG: hypothetical protein BGO33_06455 [Bacteroidia bacterium 43-41]|nr:MAG: hypothetical protein BGO33_06455 [Bacteroidia bacterium 43-41]